MKHSITLRSAAPSSSSSIKNSTPSSSSSSSPAAATHPTTPIRSESGSTHEKSKSDQKPPIWWSNLIFFISVHLIGLYGAIGVSPIEKISKQTILLTILSWQLATFGITIGYHRLWSHKSFKASIGLRWCLSFLGCLGFQGSIKWWVLRHRLHHRWTDSEFDPYNSKKGLFFSHMGWIFRKPKYEKLKLIDQTDLNQDPVVRFQHKYYVPMSIFMGFILPYLLSEMVLKSNRESRLDGLIWAGFVSRILIWHFTFLINSFAHYYGERSFDLDISARSNFLLALFTGGEANHNYHHVFPKDYRNGPDSLDWDPSKWIIYLLHRYTSLIPKINYTESSEVEEVRQRVLKITSSKRKDGGRPSKFEDIHQISLLSSSSSSSSSSSDHEPEDSPSSTETSEYNPKRRADRAATTTTPAPPKPTLPRWKRDEMLIKLVDYHQHHHYLSSSSSTPVKKPSQLRILVIDNYLVDVTQYFRSATHPGGNRILERFQLDLTSLDRLESLLNSTPSSATTTTTITTPPPPTTTTTTTTTKGIKSDSLEPLLDTFTEFERFKESIRFGDCSLQFRFEFNVHSSVAWIKMKNLRIARLVP
ncbi:hypothetical protein PGTUg99_027945 [Puccinia graminis f. sp. tritici]|uniref:Fatty acid desaturase domain-containing protein n=1 Tax=Puccinia graminis f. sp. tritici TaxID=56615 RepID=A0A5B0PL96_PUCGR|nr:hypothetical protein PGTUg99_027945 [Puccinia graminis f. sp. tritici]